MPQPSFDIDNENQWCPGCGNFGILEAMKNAFAELDLAPKDLLIISGIGQAGKTPNFIACNMLHGLHGRTLALATGAKIANHNLNIVVNTGDGDCYGEGGNHFLAAIRRNIDVTLLVHNNQVYGLTKGQASPTSVAGMKTKIQHQGTVHTPFDPIRTALATGAGFVARGFSGDTEQLTALIKEAMEHKGFSLVDIYQPCVSFNRLNTAKWYKDRIYDLNEAGHDSSDFEMALKAAHAGDDRLPIGVFYKAAGTPFHDRLPVLKEGPLLDQPFDKTEIKKIIAENRA